VTTASGKLTGGMGVGDGDGLGDGVALGDGVRLGLWLPQATSRMTTATAVTPRRIAGGFTPLSYLPVCGHEER
jgi:hypothetical protein